MSQLSISLNNTSSSGMLSFLTPYNGLTTRIQTLASSSFTDRRLSPQEINDLKQALTLSHSWSWPAGKMQALLKTIPKEIMEQLIQTIIETGNTKEIHYFLEKCFDYINNDDILTLSKIQSTENAASVFMQQGLTKEKYLEGKLNPKFTALYNWLSHETTLFFHQFMSILVSLAGLDVLNSSKGSMNETSAIDAQYKLKRYWKLLQSPAVIFAMVHSTVRVTAPAVAITALAVITILTLIIAYKRFYKPCPREIPGLENLSSHVNGNHPSTFVRRDLLMKIKTAFEANRSVLLVGKAGCGKTWLVRSFAEQAPTGILGSELSRVQLFSANAADFAGTSSRGGKIKTTGLTFNALNSIFENHKDEAVFFLDEIHSLFNNANDPKNAQALKTFTEKQRVIGATTTEEYNTYIKNCPAIAGRRFEVISLESLIGKDLKNALLQKLNSSPTKIAFNPKVFSYIVNHAARRFNPQTSILDAAMSLMELAMNKMTSYELTTLKGEINALESEIITLEQKFLGMKNTSKYLKRRNDLSEIIRTKRAKLNRKKTKLSDGNKRVEKIRIMETMLASLNEQSYRLSNTDNFDINAHTGRRWIELQAKIQTLAKCIKTEKQKLGIPPSLNVRLINSLLSQVSYSRAASSSE